MQVTSTQSENGKTMPANIFLNQLKDSVSTEECRMTNSITQNKAVLGKRTQVSMNYVGSTVRCVNVKCDLCS